MPTFFCSRATRREGFAGFLPVVLLLPGAPEKVDPPRLTTEDVIFGCCMAAAETSDGGG